MSNSGVQFHRSCRYNRPVADRLLHHLHHRSPRRRERRVLIAYLAGDVRNPPNVTMPSVLPPHLIDLVQDALLKSFWKKKALRNFLRRSHISESFLAQLNDDETKREWLDSLFPRLETTERGQALIQQMARFLAEQTTFPDLQNWEDSAAMIRTAKASVLALKDYLARKDEERHNEREVAERRQAAAENRQKMGSIFDRSDQASRKIGWPLQPDWHAGRRICLPRVVL